MEQKMERRTFAFDHRTLVATSLVDPSNNRRWYLAKPFVSVLEYANSSNLVGVSVSTDNARSFGQLKSLTTDKLHPQTRFVSAAGLLDILRFCQKPKQKLLLDTVRAVLDHYNESVQFRVLRFEHQSFVFNDSTITFKSLTDERATRWFVAAPVLTELKYSQHNSIISRAINAKHRRQLRDVVAKNVIEYGCNDDLPDGSAPIANCALLPHTMMITREGILELIQSSTMPRAKELCVWYVESVYPLLIENDGRPGGPPAEQRETRAIRETDVPSVPPSAPPARREAGTTFVTPPVRKACAAQAAHEFCHNAAVPSSSQQSLDMAVATNVIQSTVQAFVQQITTLASTAAVHDAHQRQDLQDLAEARRQNNELVAVVSRQSEQMAAQQALTSRLRTDLVETEQKRKREIENERVEHSRKYIGVVEANEQLRRRLTETKQQLRGSIEYSTLNAGAHAMVSEENASRLSTQNERLLSLRHRTIPTMDEMPHKETYLAMYLVRQPNRPTSLRAVRGQLRYIQEKDNAIAQLQSSGAITASSRGKNVRSEDEWLLYATRVFFQRVPNAVMSWNKFRQERPDLCYRLNLNRSGTSMTPLTAMQLHWKLRRDLLMCSRNQPQDAAAIQAFRDMMLDVEPIASTAGLMSAVHRLLLSEDDLTRVILPSLAEMVQRETEVEVLEPVASTSYGIRARDVNPRLPLYQEKRKLWLVSPEDVSNYIPPEASVRPTGSTDESA